jgi:hypothetical protein
VQVASPRSLEVFWLGDIQSMQGERTLAQNALIIASESSRDIFDDKMRATVKEFVGYRYAVKSLTVEYAREKDKLLGTAYAANIVTGLVFGVDEREPVKFMKNIENWDRASSVRIYRYIQRLVDIFPAQHLTNLLRSCLKHSAEEVIMLFEVNKGEAKSKDYAEGPTQIDFSSITAK